MKAYFTHLSVTLSTFVIGIAITSVFVFFTQLPVIRVTSDDFDSKSLGVNIFTERKIEIEYYYTLVSRKLSSGVFIITNKSNESIYYLGFNKNSHVRNWLNQKDKVTFATELPCLNGVENQELKPNDSAIFEIPVPRNGRPFEAGFDFKNNPEGNWKTVWIGVDSQKRFINSGLLVN